jgi:hypothetical protein
VKVYSLLYHSGSLTRKSLTPRRQDTDGLSMFATPMRLGAKARWAEFDSNRLPPPLIVKQDYDDPEHVSVRPESDAELAEWIATRDDDQMPEHRLTRLVRQAHTGRTGKNP